MSPRLAALLLFCLAPAGAAAAQGSAGPTAGLSPFRPLDLPAPNPIRTGSGRPGSEYWQQRVDYRIEATLDPARHELRGSRDDPLRQPLPDPLPYLWLFVEQNICAPGSVTASSTSRPLVFLGSTFDFSCKGFVGGLTLEHVRSGPRDLATTVYGTTMRVDLPRPLAPGAFLDLDIGWRFTVPDYGAGRMGRDGTLYELGQWYPAGRRVRRRARLESRAVHRRRRVLSRVRPLRRRPDGAGRLHRRRHRHAAQSRAGAHARPSGRGWPARRRSDTPVAIITSGGGGAARPGTRPASAGTRTWRFTADSVRDFAFGAGPDFRWDASGYRGTLVHTLYRPSAPEWEEANRMVREAAPVLQRAVVSVSLPAHHQHRGTDRGHGVSR